MKKINFRKLNCYLLVIIAVMAMAPEAWAADNVWENSDGDNDGNNANNWSLGWVPKAGDTMCFDSTSVTDCTFSGNISCDAINVTGNRIIDFNDQAITTTGDQTYDGIGEVKCGEGTITCGGSFDNKDQGTWTLETSTLVMNGTNSNETIIGKYANYLRNLTIDGTLITVHADSDNGIRVLGVMTINNGKQLTVDDNWTEVNGTLSNAGTISVNANKTFQAAATSGTTNTGTITGAGTINPVYTSITSTGTWSIANTLCWRSNTIGSGTYGGTWVCKNAQGGASHTLTMGSAASQTITWTGAVTFEADDADQTYTIDCATNDPDLVFQGDVTLQVTGGGTADINWTKGNGIITASGSDNQAVDFSGESVEGIVIDKTGGEITFGANTLTTDSLTTTNDTNTYEVDFDTNNPGVNVSGDVTLNGSNTTWNMGDGTWTVSGDFTNADVGTFNKGAGTIYFNKGARQYLTLQAGLNIGNIHLRNASTYLKMRSHLICQDLTIDSGTTFDHWGYSLRILGTFTNNGRLIPSPGTIIRIGYLIFPDSSYCSGLRRCRRKQRDARRWEEGEVLH